MSPAMRWGLIGASDIAATRVIPALRADGDTLVAVQSGTAEHATAFATTHNIAHSTTDLAELLARDVDAVYISSRNPQHAEQAIAAAHAGKHVLLEKPMATSLSDAVQVVRTCRDRGVVLAINHHLPAAGTHRMIRKLVTSGAIGRVLSAQIRHAVLLPERLRGWRISREEGAGVILDITVHDASVLNSLLGQAERVFAMTAHQGPWPSGSEDTAMVTLTFPGSVLANTFESFASPHTPTRFEINGEEGSLVAENVMTQDPVGTIFLRDAQGFREIDVTDRRDLYQVTLHDFRAAVAGDGRPTVTGEEGLAAYAVAQAALESSRSGETVTVTHPLSGN